MSQFRYKTIRYKTKDSIDLKAAKFSKSLSALIICCIVSTSFLKLRLSQPPLTFVISSSGDSSGASFTETDFNEDI